LYKGGDMTGGKVAFVTGGSRGIGQAIARALMRAGARVAITATSDDALQRAARELASEPNNAEVLPIRADVRDLTQVEQALDAAVRHFGGIDVLVNNAGIGVFRAVGDMAVDEWQKILDTNLTGVFYCCRAALPHLRARGGGWIINISSLSAKHPFADGAAYCASKAGLNAFSEALMQEVRHDGIRVACVMPGSVRTEFTGRSAGNDDWKLSPDDVAKVVVDLLSYPSMSLPSAVEIRPARPPRKS
jgi:NAD(P)-dependent dehydrogenase (short-subunit alcohol dehydrogenase family)